MSIREAIIRCLTIERDALSALIEKVGAESERAVEAVCNRKGRVFVTGVGKAGLIGQKLAATLSSTGTPSMFLHPTEAIHGDLGMLRGNDVVIAVSNSGESTEIVGLLPHLKRLNVVIIALTGMPESTLARQSDIVLDVGVECEADPLNLAPTASTTAALAMGDALAAGVMTKTGFTKEDYAKVHPGGSLGSILLARVADMMVPSDQMPIVDESTSVGDAIHEITSKRLGAAFVVDAEKRLSGILTDGDLRRLFERETHPLDVAVTAVMTANPKSISKESPAVDAMRIMETHNITVLPVVDDDGRPLSAIHMHDLIKAGLGLLLADKD